MKRLLLACVCLALTWAADAQTGRMDLEAYGRIVRLADPQIAPDAKRIAVVVSRANFDENRFDADIVLVDIASGSQRTLTSGRRGVAQPRWSPTGAELAFLAQGPASPGRDPKPQVFVMAMSGGDARRVTDSATGVQHFAWSPDGSRIAFAAADEPARASGIERHNRSFEIGNDDFLIQAAPEPTHIWLVNASGGEATRLTSGAWSLPTSFPPGPPASPLSWSADGRSIAFTRVPSPHSGDFEGAQIHLLDVAARSVRAVTGQAKFEGHPVFSPDGSRIAFWRPAAGDRNDINQIYVAPASGGEGTSATGSIDRHMARALWMPDGKSLIVGANDGTRVSLWLQPLAGAPRRAGARRRQSGLELLGGRQCREGRRAGVHRQHDDAAGRALLPHLPDGRAAAAHGSECAGRVAVARPHRNDPVARRRASLTTGPSRIRPIFSPGDGIRWCS